MHTLSGNKQHEHNTGIKLNIIQSRRCDWHGSV